jgi:hypothetical protein
MRHEQQSLALPQADFILNFQITQLGARHACRVKVRANSKSEAASLCRDNWSTIEALARENLENSPARAKLIRLKAK